ncbi:aluminum-activated malate transporter 8-like [Dorcoceras hygrometricum]|uniref:Aluminum-activated malate transporter 8-like n=1 Tax=Dorcoceras hygrometricum TaxID=472368 RepID=A0A2Z7AHV4_9LAMI|nr:aluminum-activated malate transporter 8-like [Dorcoceras hygrometricum]
MTLWSSLIEFAKATKKIGEDDPRRIVHSMKVGLALTLVSLLYYFRPLYDGFGQAGMWAILTVVVVFEFTVGGTLSKSFNRSCATMVAGALGIGAEYLANLCGERGEPVIVAILVFVLATMATFTRFYPSVKRKCDYGVLIFILTFTLVAVSGFRAEILRLAHQRLSTIIIGGITCMIISIFVYPVWAGQDLHDLVATNIEKLALYLESFAGEGFHSSVENNDNSRLQGYKSVLNSKATEEALANFAWWEPGHGSFRFNHPWKQYLKIGAHVSECACHVKALDGYAASSKIKPASETCKNFQKPCTTMSSESARALKDLASAIKTLKSPSSDIQIHIQSSKSAANEFESILKNMSLPQPDGQELMQLLVVASILIDITKCVEQISDSIHELSMRADFEEQTPRDNESC